MLKNQGILKQQEMTCKFVMNKRKIKTPIHHTKYIYIFF